MITGQRRVGKSILLQQISTFRKKDEVLFLDFEQRVWHHLKDKDAFYDFLKKECSKNIKALCIDEIQTVAQREEVIVSIHNEFPNIEIFITGSNSSLLSSHLTTHLRGRYTQTHIRPFSYTEYCTYHKSEKGHESFLAYMQDG